jgi:hypothetical protein
MIIFLTGCFVGGFVATVVMCCLAMAGREGDKDENKEKES